MRAISVDIHGMIIWNFGGTSKRGKDAYLKNLSHISNHKAKRNGEERLPLLVVDEEKKRDDVCTRYMMLCSGSHISLSSS